MRERASVGSKEMQATETRRKLGSAGDALAWMERACSLIMSTTSRGFVERSYPCE